MEMISPPPEFDITFRRAYDTYRYSLPDGRIATGISQPTWDTFRQAFSELESTGTPGDIIISPELITAAGVEDNDDIATAVMRHEAEARELSRLYPSSMLLLGTAGPVAPASKPRNALSFISNGAEVGRTYKMVATNQAERQVFDQSATLHDVRQPQPGIQALICADLLYGVGKPRGGPRLVHPGTHTVLVSSCWATPSAGREYASPEAEHRQLLEMCVSDLFQSNPGLQLVAMIDRLPEWSRVGAPLNFTARR